MGTRETHAGGGSHESSPSSIEAKNASLNYRSDQFKGGWAPSAEYIDDLHILLRLDSDTINRYIDYINKGAGSGPSEDAAFIEHELRVTDETVRATLQSIVAFHIALFVESPEQIPLYCGDLMLQGGISQNERDQLTSIFAQLEPTYKALTEKNIYKKSFRRAEHQVAESGKSLKEGDEIALEITMDNLPSYERKHLGLKIPTGTINNMPTDINEAIAFLFLPDNPYRLRHMKRAHMIFTGDDSEERKKRALALLDRISSSRRSTSLTSEELLAIAESSAEDYIY